MILAMPQRDETIEEIKRLERPSRIRFGASSALLEYAVMHGDEAEAEPPTLRLWRSSRLRAELVRKVEAL